MSETGYTRQSAANIVTGNLIQAADLNAEFNQLQSAFSASVGHFHDGTPGCGQPIPPAGLGSLTGSSAGLLIANGSNAFGTVTLTGTSGQITITNGTGVSGNPTIAIDAAYTGGSSITTLGTVTAGTWHGSIIAGTYGGTGINNGANTITVGGNFSSSSTVSFSGAVSASGAISLTGALTTAGAFTTVGANALTLTTTAATNVTLPTLGTLATLGNTETLSNKTLTSPVLTNAVVSIVNGTLDNVAIGNSTPLTGKFTTIVGNSFTPNNSAIPANGMYLPASNLVGIAANSAPSMEFGYYGGTGTPVNFVRALNVGTGFFPFFEADGTDTNVTFILQAKGTGGVVFNTNGPASGNAYVTQASMSHTASAVNHIDFTGAATTASPQLRSLGSDTDIGLTLTPKGAGKVISTAPLDLSGSSAGQIIFPATQNPSSNVNTLDDYEEGTWTPTISLTSGSVTIGSASGVYTKIGRMVTVQCTINLSAVSSPSGIIMINGLPFTSAFRASTSFWINAFSSSFTGVPQGYVDNASNSILLQEFAAGAISNPGNTLTSSSTFACSVTYFV